jgi:transcriptional regulator of acetoin/glycerol metabolism
MNLLIQIAGTVIGFVTVMLATSLVVSVMVRVVHYLGNKRSKTLGEMLGGLNQAFRSDNGDHPQPGDAPQTAFVLDVLTYPTLHLSNTQVAASGRAGRYLDVQAKRQLLAARVEYISKENLIEIITRLSLADTTLLPSSPDVEIPARWYGRLPPERRTLAELGRRDGPYVPLNMAALPESLADAELFGHRRGAFTGAVTSRVGAFEQAHEGTLFLDEIAELPLSIQVKLLRVVEDGMVRAVGATQALRVAVRLVSASWARLDERVVQGSFRADLYHRLSTVVVELPPLRERRSDIAQLSHSLLRRLRADVGERTLSSAALARLVDQSWPGNVRELGAVLYRAAASADYEIAARHVDEASRPTPNGRRPARDARALLEQCAGNVSQAARAAGVPRSTFRAWLSRAGAEGAPSTAPEPAKTP